MGKEMISPEFKRCLEKREIVLFEKGPSLVSKELNTANDDLLSSKDSYGRENYKWATIQAYYSMFHSARALIYAQKYREKNHYCLIVALENLYVKRRIIEKNIIENLTLGKELRESADYGHSFSKQGAYNLIKASENILKEAKKILKEK